MSYHPARQAALVTGLILLAVIGWIGTNLSVGTRVLAAAESATVTDSGLKLEAIVVGKPDRIEVLPAKFALQTPRRQMHLVVSGFYGSDRVQDLTRSAEFSSTNPAVAKVVGGVVYPVANGRAEIVARVGELTQKVPVEVSGQETSEAVSFQYGTLPALSKQGCNQGACHGSPSGKGGFRLSLRAYDAVLDTETVIRE